MVLAKARYLIQSLIGVSRVQCNQGAKKLIASALGPAYNEQIGAKLNVLTLMSMILMQSSRLVVDECS